MGSVERKAEGAQDAEKRSQRSEDSLRIAPGRSRQKVADVCREMGVSQQMVYAWNGAMPDWD
jgi:hypothetical protein